MGDLSVIVRLHGTVVENRVVPVVGPVRIGEAPGADVPFPGADLTVTRSGEHLRIRGRSLAEGEDLTIQLGKVEVSLEHTLRASIPRDWGGRHFDARFLMVLVLVAVSATWIDAFDHWATVHLPSARGFQVVDRAVKQIWSVEPRFGRSSESQRAAAVPRTETQPAAVAVRPVEAAGPRHVPDDSSSRVRWYRWYRAEVPTDTEQLDAAVAAHLQDPYNTEARTVLGQSAYNSDRYTDAMRQFQDIVDLHPEDPDARRNLARAQMRLGLHDAEIRHLQAVLRRNDEDIEARGSLAVALTRIQRLDEAAGPLDELRVEHPHHPVTVLAEAKVAALAGRDAEALQQLDELMLMRSTLSASARLEVRRDIALDPAFARLRKNVRLRSMINRHLGAAGPRPIR